MVEDGLASLRELLARAERGELVVECSGTVTHMVCLPTPDDWERHHETGECTVTLSCVYPARREALRALLAARGYVPPGGGS
jgi:hypothetical protein